MAYWEAKEKAWIQCMVNLLIKENLGLKIGRQDYGKNNYLLWTI